MPLFTIIMAWGSLGPRCPKHANRGFWDHRPQCTKNVKIIPPWSGNEIQKKCKNNVPPQVQLYPKSGFCEQNNWKSKKWGGGLRPPPQKEWAGGLRPPAHSFWSSFLVVQLDFFQKSWFGIQIGLCGICFLHFFCISLPDRRGHCFYIFCCIGACGPKTPYLRALGHLGASTHWNANWSTRTSNWTLRNMTWRVEPQTAPPGSQTNCNPLNPKLHPPKY